MRSLIFVIVWSVLFIVFGLYVNSEVYTFTGNYTSKIEIIGEYIEANNFDSARDNLVEFSKIWHKEKSQWYKLLNHEYFDIVCLNINIIDKALILDDKSRALESIELIKMTLNNMLESEKCDLNHIF